MKVEESLETRAGVNELFGWVEDLGRYPDWLEIVARAEPTAALEGDPGPAWMVDLRGRVGPLARSKRLRMVRVEHVASERVVFERAEKDDRRHAPWVLSAETNETGNGSVLTMVLDYRGRLWAKPLELILRDEIAESKQRLLAQLEKA